jgi:hypothetical protein
VDFKTRVAMAALSGEKTLADSMPGLVQTEARIDAVESPRVFIHGNADGGISRFEVADIPLNAAKRLRHQAEGGSVATQLNPMTMMNGWRDNRTFVFTEGGSQWNRTKSSHATNGLLLARHFWLKKRNSRGCATN